MGLLILALASCTREPTVSDLIDDLAVPEREEAARDGLVVRGSSALPEITKALPTREERVRTHLVHLLPKIGPPGKVGPILVTALDDPIPNVRYLAAMGLRDLGESSSYIAAEALSERLLVEKDQGVLGALANALVHNGSRGCEMLIACLGRSKDPSVTQAVLESLGITECRTSEAVPVLLDVLSDSRDGGIVAAAALAIACCSTKEQGAEGALKEKLPQVTGGARFQVAYSLATLTGEGQYVDLCTDMMREEDGRHSANYAFAFSACGRGSLPVLRTGLQLDVCARRAAIALEAMGPEAMAAKDDLEALVKRSRDSDTIQDAIRALQAIAKGASIEVIVQALSHENAEVRRVAREAVISLSLEGAVPKNLLLQIIEGTPDSGLRDVVLLMRELDSCDPDVSAALIGRVEGKAASAAVRQAVYCNLQAICRSDPAVMSRLARLMMDPSEDVRLRKALIEGINILCSDEELNALLALLSRSEGSMIPSILDALEKVGPRARAAIPVLRRMSGPRQWKGKIEAALRAVTQPEG